MGSVLVCPYGGCGKVFEQPVLLTDEASFPRETYYACPHCLAKLDLVLKDAQEVDTVEVVASHDVDAHVSIQETPKNCKRHLGYLKTLPEDSSIPDDCLVCPKIMQCYVHART
jgi:hypothetical protein